MRSDASSTICCCFQACSLSSFPGFRPILSYPGGLDTDSLAFTFQVIAATGSRETDTSCVVYILDGLGHSGGTDAPLSSGRSAP